MVSLPLVFAPLRALIGFRSDHHRSVLGWRRVPYIWFGTLLQFGGFAIMPFALLVLTRRRPRARDLRPDRCGPRLSDGRRRPAHHPDRRLGAGDRPRPGPDARPRVVALLYVMLLVGMLASAFVFGALLPTSATSSWSK